MQTSAFVFALLVYIGGVLRGWAVLKGPEDTKAMVLFALPGILGLATLWAPLLIPPCRRMLKRYVWLSFTAGYGQTVMSVLTGLGVLAAVAVLLFVEIAQAAAGARWPAGAFAALGAGLGVLAAQAVLTRFLEREPQVRLIILV
jgi:hypothetical protein